MKNKTAKKTTIAIDEKTIESIIKGSRLGELDKKTTADQWSYEDYTQEIFCRCLERGIDLTSENIGLIKTAVRRCLIDDKKSERTKRLSFEYQTTIKQGDTKEGEEVETGYEFLTDSRMGEREQLGRLVMKEADNVETLSTYLSRHLSKEEGELFDALYIRGERQKEIAEDMERSQRQIKYSVKKLTDKLPGLITMRDLHYEAGTAAPRQPSPEFGAVPDFSDSLDVMENPWGAICYSEEEEEAMEKATKEARLFYIKKQSAFLSFFMTENKPFKNGKIPAPDCVLSWDDTEKIIGEIVPDYVYQEGTGLVLSKQGEDKAKIKRTLKEVLAKTQGKETWAIIKTAKRALKKLAPPFYSGKSPGWNSIALLSDDKELKKGELLKQIRIHRNMENHNINMDKKWIETALKTNPPPTFSYPDRCKMERFDISERSFRKPVIIKAVEKPAVPVVHPPGWNGWEGHGLGKTFVHGEG